MKITAWRCMGPSQILELECEHTYIYVCVSALIKLSDKINNVHTEHRCGGDIHTPMDALPGRASMGV